jgi:hypothetical protein
MLNIESKMFKLKQTKISYLYQITDKKSKITKVISNLAMLDKGMNVIGLDYVSEAKFNSMMKTLFNNQ